MGRPRPADLRWLRAQGVTALVSLTEVPPPGADGIDIYHVPVPDMTSPTLSQIHDIVAYMRRVVDGGGKVVAHCAAGIGRTGTALAAYLVSEGLSAREAIRRVRQLRPGSVETPDQERALVHYAELVGGRTE